MRFLALIVAIFAVAGSIHAAPVTSGSVRIEGVFGVRPFYLSGGNFNVEGDFVSGTWPVDFCTTCGLGTMLDVSGAVSGLDFESGSGEFMGTSFPNLDWGDLFAASGSEFEFTGPSIELTGPGTFTGTFTFTGQLCGTLGGPGPVNDCALLLTDLTGRGIVTIEVVQELDPGAISVQSVEYTFIPEPSTFVVSVPLGLLLVRRFLQQKRIGRQLLHRRPHA